MQFGAAPNNSDDALDLGLGIDLSEIASLMPQTSPLREPARIPRGEPSLTEIAQLLKVELNLPAETTTATAVERACADLEVQMAGLSLLAKAHACWQILGSPEDFRARTVESPRGASAVSAFDPEKRQHAATARMEAAAALLARTEAAAAAARREAAAAQAEAVAAAAAVEATGAVLLAPAPAAPPSGEINGMLNYSQLAEWSQSWSDELPFDGFVDAESDARAIGTGASSAITTNGCASHSPNAASGLMAQPVSGGGGSAAKAALDTGKLPRPCSSCRESRVLCDRATPCCGRCARLGRECTLPKSVPRGRPPGSKTGAAARAAENSKPTDEAQRQAASQRQAGAYGGRAGREVVAREQTELELPLSVPDAPPAGPFARAPYAAAPSYGEAAPHRLEGSDPSWPSGMQPPGAASLFGVPPEGGYNAAAPASYEAPAGSSNGVHGVYGGGEPARGSRRGRFGRTSVDATAGSDIAMLYEHVMEQSRRGKPGDGVPASTQRERTWHADDEEDEVAVRERLAGVGSFEQLGF